ncbi:hypothetical protein [Burkholderia cenocepacia]|uniref:hypothetical protein n=1 Tax=Burkholderia cenocepacia TaxID=95486 RepID=UPI0011778F92|nr:hypothetical protein [Burkholderia cenocepacia]
MENKKDRVAMSKAIFEDYFNKKVTHHQMSILFGLLGISEGKIIIFTNPEDLALKLGPKWNKKNVGKALKALVAGGYIFEIERVGVKGYELNTNYFLTEDLIQELLD